MDLISSAVPQPTSLFRHAGYVSERQGHLQQAQKVAADSATALESRISTGGDLETLSLYDAFQLVLAIAAARENERAEAYSTSIQLER